MTTVQNWLDRTRGYLQSNVTSERNQLNADYTAGSGTLTLKYPLGGITKGARLSVGLNVFYVWDVTAAGLTATVTAGEGGATDVNVASGATVHVRPFFTDYELSVALTEELQALSSPQNGLFQVKTFDLTYNPAIDGYDLPGVTDLQSIYEVRYQEPGPYKDWPRLPAYEYRLDRKAFATDFPSGNALKIMRGGWSGYDVRLLYKAPYAPFTAVTDDVTTVDVTTVCGVSAQAADIPPIGAAIRMMAGREIKRNFTEGQPDTRRMEEVPAGAIAASSRGLMLLRQQRVSDELGRLSAMYPAVQAR